MNKNIFKIALGVVLGSAMVLTSCNKEPDESNLYTFTGETIQDYLEANDSIFHKFNIIMKRAGYNRMMDTYGQYTCYAPINEGVDKYVDSLYNDKDAKIEHNGMTENSVEGLTDEQCKEIAQYHLSASMYSYIEQLSSPTDKEITTMLNTPFISKEYDDGITRFNEVAAVISYDNEMTNGYVHVIDNVIPHTTRNVAEIIEKRPEFSVFFAGLEKTGLLDSLAVTDKGKTYSLDNISGRPGSGFASGKYYVPAECKIKFTIFAVTNETLANYGITEDFQTLKNKCIEWYANAQDWYEYPDMENNPISTNDDYTNPYNVVNMFYRYHILKAGMPVSKLVFERDQSNDAWNFSFGGEPFEYYETMLPHTLMKIWQPLYHPTGASSNIWINRWRQNNTLTDVVGTFGTEENHQILRAGSRIDRTNSNIQAYNGYIHTISEPLIYDKDVPQGVLHERLRIDAGAMLPELINNSIRFATAAQIGERNLSGNDGTMVRLPLDYFDNIHCYNTKTKLSWYTWGAWRAWNCDQLSGWDENDFALRLPPVPSGDYEIRIIYPPMANGGLQQYYIGTSNDPSTMIPLGLPFDARYPNSANPEDRNATGYMLSDEFDDYGVASDLIMRNHGYMRAPASFARGTYNAVKTPVEAPADLIASISNCCRYEEGYGTSMMRKILGTVSMKQGNEYWLRLKNLLTGYDQLGFSIDFIELVPLDVVNSQDYTEDWY